MNFTCKNSLFVRETSLSSVISIIFGYWKIFTSFPLLLSLGKNIPNHAMSLLFKFMVFPSHKCSGDILLSQKINIQRFWMDIFVIFRESFTTDSCMGSCLNSSNLFLNTLFGKD